MDERYPLHIAMRLKIFSICLKTDVFRLLRELKRPLPIVLCEESPYNLISPYNRPFFRHFAAKKFLSS